MSFCTRCGASNGDSFKFCGNCGTTMSASLYPPQQPQVVQLMPTVVVARQPKSVGVAILLTVLFGPLGMLYSTVAGALVMLVVSVVLGVPTGGLSVAITWPICIIWGAVAAQNWNQGR
jgi:hypothetical protein